MLTWIYEEVVTRGLFIEGASLNDRLLIVDY